MRTSTYSIIAAFWLIGMIGLVVTQSALPTNPVDLGWLNMVQTTSFSQRQAEYEVAKGMILAVHGFTSFWLILGAALVVYRIWLTAIVLPEVAIEMVSKKVEENGLA